MAGKSQAERVAALEAQVSRLTDTLQETLEVLGKQSQQLAAQRQPNPHAGYDPTALMVAMLDRMPNPTPPPPQTDVLDLALKLAKELRPPAAESNPIQEATNLLAPVIMDVLAQRNGTPVNGHAAAAPGADGGAGH